MQISPIDHSELVFDPGLIEEAYRSAERCIGVYRQKGDFLQAALLTDRVNKCKENIAFITKIEGVEKEKIESIQDQIGILRAKCEKKSLVLDPLIQLNTLRRLFKQNETYKTFADYTTLEVFLRTLETDEQEIENAKREFKLPEVSRTGCRDEATKRLALLTQNFDTSAKKIKKLRSSQKIWKPRKVEEGAAYLKMLNNALKACEEARNKLYKAQDLPAYASPTQATALLLTPLPVDPLPPKSAIFSSEAKGKRSAMEDAHFCIEDENKILAGVFDGHGGSGVSNYVNEVFSIKFEAALAGSSGNVHEAFENVFGEIQNELEEKQKKGECKGGSTAVVIYVDKAKRLVYTATLGDSEANVYRVFNEKMKSIPLSCVRDWSSQKDANRMAVYHEDPEFAERWPKMNPKILRSGDIVERDCGGVKDLILDFNSGVNVSRAFGDFRYRGKEKAPLVISKPKITVNRLQEGDIVVLACDGLKDFVPEKEIIKIIQRSGGEDIAENLVNSALGDSWKSTDNVTVVVIKI
jgi:serine/threonine protein phosphatase PrpC